MPRSNIIVFPSNFRQNLGFLKYRHQNECKFFKSRTVSECPRRRLAIFGVTVRVAARIPPLCSRSHTIVPSRVSINRLAAASRRSNCLRNDPATRSPSRYVFTTRERPRSMSCLPVDLVLVARLGLLLVLVRPAQREAKIGHLGVLGVDPAFQRLHSPRRGLRCGCLELEPAGVELPRQRVRERSGLTLRLAQFLAA